MKTLFLVLFSVVLPAVCSDSVWAGYRRFALPSENKGVYSAVSNAGDSAANTTSVSSSATAGASTYVAAGIRSRLLRENMRGRAQRAISTLDSVLESSAGQQFLSSHTNVTIEPTRVYGATGEIVIKVSGPTEGEVQRAASELHSLLRTNPDVAFAGVAGTLEIH